LLDLRTRITVERVLDCMQTQRLQLPQSPSICVLRVVAQASLKAGEIDLHAGLCGEHVAVAFGCRHEQHETPGMSSRQLATKGSVSFLATKSQTKEPRPINCKDRPL
jgi:hypothetical protein